MNLIEDFDVSAWFSEYTGKARITPADLEYVFWFAILWNTLEARHFDEKLGLSAMIQKAEGARSNGQLDADLTPHIDAIRELCPDHSETGVRNFFEKSEGGGGAEDVGILSRVLTKATSDPDQMLRAMVFVAYRVRNNLFHGAKRPHELHLQKRLFDAVNSFLAILMDALPQVSEVD